MPAIILTTLNARYIHASLGLRYLLANMARHGGEDLRAQTVLREFTIARPPREIADALLAELGETGDNSEGVQIIGFGIYIWNVRQTTEVVRLLRAARPQLKIVLGGPEVSHEWAAQAVVQLADHLITGWGDVSFPKLCRALVDGTALPAKVIAGEQPALSEIAFPYAGYSDADLAHRLLYVEASRGCPFRCEFCLSSLDKTAQAFDQAAFLAELDTLWQRGARHFRFVDRTFNLKIEDSVRLLEFFIDRMTDGLFLHFELVPDHLPARLRETIARFPPGVLQFEIGIQTFNPAVQHLISRRQDDARTEANLRWLLTHSHAHLHADLIFGLPGEDLASFAAGFDRLHAIGPHEIQLGLLKRLRGAPIARHTAPHAMIYDPDPPHAVRQTGVLDAESVKQFKRFARYWDLVANSGRFPRGLALLLQGPSAFAAFMAFSVWLWQRHGRTADLTPEMLVDALFDYLTHSLGHPGDAVRDALRADYRASGARANPRRLQAAAGEPVPPSCPPTSGLARRQARHGRTARSG